ncbi:hypothetical protein [Bacillus seohaeanensis]|uniref:Uncharacterized protein n=1 Tax=Bacillus seohaeanensis TaxID=284580 RepID=A0ABW5RS30_9BACI
MIREENLIKAIKEMSETEAKDILAKIFRKVNRVNGINYTSEDCYKDIEKIYGEKVAGKMIFDK